MHYQAVIKETARDYRQRFQQRRGDRQMLEEKIEKKKKMMAGIKKKNLPIVSGKINYLM